MAKTGNRIENLIAALGRLSKRERYMVGGVSIMFLLFVTTLTTMWVNSTLSSLESRIESKTKKLQSLIDDRQAFEAAKVERERMDVILERGKNIKLMQTIEEAASRLGVNVEDMQPRSPSVNAEAGVQEDKVEVNIKLITIDRLVDFLKDIERKSQTVAIRKLRIKQSFQQPDQLEVGFTVSNFKLVKDKQGGNGGPAKAPAPKPKKAK